MPVASDSTKGCMWPSHWLKFPTTDTALALGAQTAKRVPVTPSSRSAWAPRLSSISKGLMMILHGEAAHRHPIHGGHCPGALPVQSPSSLADEIVHRTP